jgi:hypothetical protein
MDKHEARKILLDSLRIARERVTGETLELKARRLAELNEAIGEVTACKVPASSPLSAVRLRELLGNPDGHQISEAIDSWAATFNVAGPAEGPGSAGVRFREADADQPSLIAEFGLVQGVLRQHDRGAQDDSATIRNGQASMTYLSPVGHFRLTVEQLD